MHGSATARCTVRNEPTKYIGKEGLCDPACRSREGWGRGLPFVSRVCFFLSANNQQHISRSPANSKGVSRGSPGPSSHACPIAWGACSSLPFQPSPLRTLSGRIYPFSRWRRVRLRVSREGRYATGVRSKRRRRHCRALSDDCRNCCDIPHQHPANAVRGGSCCSESASN